MDGDPETLVLGPLEVCAAERSARLNGHPLVLSALELMLLVALARRPGQTVRRETLYREVWGFALRPGDRSVDVYVHKLRGKLEQALPGWSFIHTHTGWGYRLDPEQHDKGPIDSRSASLPSAGGTRSRCAGGSTLLRRPTPEGTAESQALAGAPSTPAAPPALV